MNEPTTSPLIGHDDSHLTPIALNGVAAPPADEVYQAAVKLLSGTSAPSPAQPPAPTKVKTLSQLAEEIFAEGKDE